MNYGCIIPFSSFINGPYAFSSLKKGKSAAVNRCPFYIEEFFKYSAPLVKIAGLKFLTGNSLDCGTSSFYLLSDEIFCLCTLY